MSWIDKLTPDTLDTLDAFDRRLLLDEIDWRRRTSNDAASYTFVAVALMAVTSRSVPSLTVRAKPAPAPMLLGGPVALPRADEVLTPEAVAAVLAIPRKTVVALCAEGRLVGAFKAGRRWRVPGRAVRKMAGAT